MKCSIESGRVPVEWKRADLVPIYKSGGKEEPLNYRPLKVNKKQIRSFIESL